MFTLFDFVIDSDGIALTILGFEKFTLFSVALARRPRVMAGIMLFNIPIGVVGNS